MNPAARVLYIGAAPPEQGGRRAGGIATHAWEMARRMARAGHDVALYHDGLRGSRRRDGVTLCGRFALPVRRLLAAGREIAGRRPRRSAVQRRLESLVETFRPDLVHVHSLHNACTAALKGLYPALPVVVTDHGFWHRPVTGEVRANYAAADAVIAVSHWCRENEDRLLGDRPGRCVIPNPLDAEGFGPMDRAACRARWGLPPTGRILLFVAGAGSAEHKGLQRLRDALVQGDLGASTMLVAIGGGDARRCLRGLPAAVKANVRHLAPVARRRLPELLNAADLLVVPSRDESFGLIYAEALLCGICCVGFDRSIGELARGMNAYVGEGVAAGADAAALAAAIHAALRRAGDVDRGRLAAAARASLSWDRMMPEYAAVYSKVLQRG